jgi:hypothetical protein
MQKIPTCLVREFGPDIDCPATDEIRHGCEWVFRGEGTAFRKYDGQCVGLFGGTRYKRRTIRPADDGDVSTVVPGEANPVFYKPPDGWQPAQRYPRENEKWPGWVPIDEGDPQNQYLVEAFERYSGAFDGTFEAVGPKIQGNPHGFDKHILIRHLSHRVTIGNVSLESVDALANLLERLSVEGIVWKHHDGRYAKIKRTDFGLDWPVEE